MKKVIEVRIFSDEDIYLNNSPEFVLKCTVDTDSTEFKALVENLADLAENSTQVNVQS